MLMDPIYLVHNSQVFTAWKICQFRNHSDFKSLFPIHIFLSFSIRNFFFDRWQMCVHNLLKPVGWVHQEQRWNKRAPDLAWFSTYSLFGPLRFSSFVYILARLYLSISVQLEWVWRRIAEQPSTPLLSTLQKVKTKRKRVSTLSCWTTLLSDQGLHFASILLCQASCSD